MDKIHGIYDKLGVDSFGLISHSQLGWITRNSQSESLRVATIQGEMNGIELGQCTRSETFLISHFSFETYSKVERAPRGRVVGGGHLHAISLYYRLWHH